jgi:hypothetical protein
MYSGYGVSFPEVKLPGCGVDRHPHPTPPPSIVEFKDIIEVYLYFTAGPLWPVVG